VLDDAQVSHVAVPTTRIVEQLDITMSLDGAARHPTWLIAKGPRATRIASG
jgi:hypothetical protein